MLKKKLWKTPIKNLESGNTIWKILIDINTVRHNIALHQRWTSKIRIKIFTGDNFYCIYKITLYFLQSHKCSGMYYPNSKYEGQISIHSRGSACCIYNCTKIFRCIILWNRRIKVEYSFGCKEFLTLILQYLLNDETMKDYLLTSKIVKLTNCLET